MAKRKRLTPAQPLDLDRAGGAPETKSVFPPGLGARSAPPIAQVAGEAASVAALQDLANEVRSARSEGRIIQVLPLDSVDEGYLVRDRMLADEEELSVLMESLVARGQQTPIEVVDLKDGRYGLISGWRRLTALRRLAGRAGQGEEGPQTVLAVLRRPETASDAYLSMVEENEIRVGLSFYERARIVARAAEQGVYPDTSAALAGLFASASRSKRSKIGSFLRLYEALNDRLSFPSAISERLGLALVKALQVEPELTDRLRERLRKAPAENAAAEIAALERALKGGIEKQSLTRKSESNKVSKVGPDGSVKQRDKQINGINIQVSDNRLILSGPGLTQGFRSELEAWLARR